MEEQKVYFTGRPTGPDVEKIKDTFKELNEGDQVEYIKISEIISEPVGSNRFNTVLSAYRKRMERDHNIIFQVMSNVGLIVQNPSQRISFSSNHVAKGIKRIVRGGNIASKTTAKNLTNEEIKTRDHVVNLATTIKVTAATAAQKLRWENCSLKTIEQKAA